MFQLILFSFCIYGAINLRVMAISVSEFNALVQNPAWRKLTTQEVEIKFLFRGKNFENNIKEFTLNELFPHGSDTNIITDQNFIDRVWQFHLLLSVYYGIDLQHLIELSIDFWHHCKNNYNNELQIVCLKSLANNYQIVYKEFKKMKISLLYFFKIVKLSMRTKENILINNINFILNNLIEIGEIDNHLSDESFINCLITIQNEIRLFFNEHTSILRILEGNLLESISSSSWYINNPITQQDHDKPIQVRYQTNIRNLVQSNSSYGFQYDPKFFDVILKAISVSEFNDLVQNPAWRKLTTQEVEIKFLFRGKNFENNIKEFTLNELFSHGSDTNIITDQNFIDRVWQFHLLLSVYYGIDLQRLTELSIDFWHHCKNNYNNELQFVCLNSLANNYQIVYKEFKKMRNSLLYFFKMVKLSMHTIEYILINHINVILNNLIEIGKIDNLLLDESFINCLITMQNEIRLFFNEHTTILRILKGNLSESISSSSWYINNPRAQQDHDKPIQVRYQTYIRNLVQSNSSYGFQ